MHEGRRGAAWEAAGVAQLRLLQTAVQRAQPFGRGSISGAPPYTCGRVIRGIFFPPSLLQAQGTLRPAGIGPRRGDATPPSLRVSYSSSPTSPFSVSNSVSMRHLGPSHVGQGLCPPEHWTGSSGVRCRPRFRRQMAKWSTRRASAGWLANAPAGHPEPGSAGPLASLGHRYLPPELTSGVHHRAAPWSAAVQATSLGLRGRPNP